jgi:DeoR family transcriptional regulator, catabolite repression regulator
VRHLRLERCDAGQEQKIMPLFKELRTISTAAIKQIEQPADHVTPSLNSRATEVFTDFTTQNPMMLEQNTSIDDAREIMKRTHVKFKMVIDVQETFRGVITLEDLMSAKVIREMENHSLRRHELTVAHVMTPRSALRAVDSRDFVTASIGDVLATMKKYGEMHLLVVDSERGSVRGIVSANTIARKMHVPVTISERANSFSDIYRAITL